jgi:hypothetical protein
MGATLHGQPAAVLAHTIMRLDNHRRETTPLTMRTAASANEFLALLSRVEELQRLKQVSDCLGSCGCAQREVGRRTCPPQCYRLLVCLSCTLVHSPTDALCNPRRARQRHSPLSRRDALFLPLHTSSCVSAASDPRTLPPERSSTLSVNCASFARSPIMMKVGRHEV